MTKCVLYGLASTADGVIRYVGQTMDAPDKRYARHLVEARRKVNKGRLVTWIREQWAAGQGIKLIIINGDAEWNVSERSYIAGLRAQGREIINTMPGGTYGNKDVKSVKRKIAGYADDHRTKNSSVGIWDLTGRWV